MQITSSMTLFGTVTLAALALAMVHGVNSSQLKVIEVPIGNLEESPYIDPFSKIDALAFTFQYNAGVNTVCEDNNGTDIGSYVYVDILNAIIGYYYVDFGDGATSAKINLAVDYGDTDEVLRLNFHLDSVTNEPFHFFDITTTGEWYYFKTISKDVVNVPTGVHGLYITFNSDSIHDDQPYICQINWFQFYK